jgi:hypothetical protein
MGLATESRRGPHGRVPAKAKFRPPFVETPCAKQICFFGSRLGKTLCIFYDKLLHTDSKTALAAVAKLSRTTEMFETPTRIVPEIPLSYV